MLALVADYALDEVTSADILVVPGGIGDAPARGRRADARVDPRDRRRQRRGRRRCAPVRCCSRAAGLLEGKEATTHWASLDLLREYGAIPTSERVVEQGKIITAAGVSSGIDMALTLAAHIAGDEFAQAIQLGIEYDPQPPFDSGSVAKAPDEILELASPTSPTTPPAERRTGVSDGRIAPLLTPVRVSSRR